MFQGFYSGISGLQTNQYGLDVIADNLANVQTTGFKSTTTEFSDIFSKVAASSSNYPTKDDIGVGARVQATTTIMHQGSLMPSDRFNDMSIEGNGWFGVVSKGDTYYTRNGHFQFDTYQSEDGDVNSSIARLVTDDGMYVTGTMLDNFAYNAGFDYGDTALNGVSGAYVLNNPVNYAELAGSNSQTTLEFPTRLAYPVTPSTESSFFGNLGRENIPYSISANVVSPNNDVNRIKLTFTQHIINDTNGDPLPWDGLTWDLNAKVTSNDGSIVYDDQNGQVLFSTSGGVTSSTISSVNNDGSPVAINLGSGFNGVTSIDGLAVSGSSQSDGLSGGTLTNYGVDRNGVILAEFSNGRQSAIGRVAIYHFQNDQGLDRISGTLMKESANSGQPTFWTDPNGNVITGATIRSHSLEMSNVRTEVALTDMIITQRAYQANGKIITTVDEMIQKALAMHR